MSIAAKTPTATPCVRARFGACRCESMTPPHDRSDITEPILSQLDALNADSADPIDPIEAKLPTDPIDKNERVLAILRKESSDAIESSAAMPTACHTLCDASRHAMRPFFGVKLLFDQVSRRLELGFGVIAEFGVVPPLEVPHKGVNDLQPGHLSLRFERVNPLISTCRALIDELIATDPHHFHHLVRIDVIGHRGVMQYVAGGEPFLCGTGDLADIGDDLVKRNAPGINPQFFERIKHPRIEELI